jgi:Replication initiator protein A
MTKTGRTWERKMSGKDLPTQLVKLESNFEEYPLGQLGKKPTGKPLLYNTKNVLEDGTVVEGEWTLIPSSEYHEPLGFDFDVYFAVAELVERNGGMPEDGVVDFSLYQLREIIGLQPGGKTYSQIRRSLELWALLGIRSKRAFWQHGECKHITDFFRIWDVTFDDSKKGGGGDRALHTISFNQRYRRNFLDNYITGISSEVYWGLSSRLARRLYRLIERMRAGGGSYEINIFEWKRRIPLMGNYPKPSKIKQKLKKAHDELLSVEFLSQIEFPANDRVRYVLSDAFLSERRVLELSGSEEEFAAIRLLASCGLRGDVARDLVAEHGPAHCTRYANALPHQKNLRNPAGWLRRAIEEGFELPNTSPRQRHSARPVLFSEEHEEARTLVRPDRVIPHEDDENAAEVLQLEPVEPPASDSKAQQAWANLVEALIAFHGRDSLPPWFGDFEGGELEGSTITILVPNNFAANHLKENFGEDLVHLWRERSGDEDAVLQVTTDLSSGVRAQLCVNA